MPADPKAPLRLLGSTIAPGAKSEMVGTINPRDEARILREIRNAADQADEGIVTSHTHESGKDVLVPTAWTKEFGRKAIEGGASTCIVHGPHQRPGEKSAGFPTSPVWYESVVAVPFGR